MASHVAMPELLPDLHVAHTELHPVFVLGCGRSGTSMFGALLRKYVRTNFGPETQFIVDYYKRLHQYGDLSRDANFDLLLADIAAERCFHRWNKRFGFSLDISRVKERVTNRSYAGVLTAVFEEFAAHNGMVRWGDKSPNYDRDLPIILELFPQARFIHIVRDGRDVALSHFNVFFGAKNAYKAAVDWRQQVGWVRAFKATAPPGQFLEVRYEDVLTAPRDVFRRVITFLAIRDPHDELLDFITARIREDIRPDTAGKWRNDFTARQNAVFQAVAADTLRAFNYPVVGRQVRLGPLMRAYYLLDNRVRRWINVEYQRDNVYAIKRRLRRYSQPLRRVLKTGAAMPPSLTTADK